MSELTPNEIADYPLRTGVRGYRVEQVDELLDRVADRIETLERALADARQRLQAAERRAEESSATEATLKRTLVTAQRAAEDTVAEARTEAASIRSDAQEQADELLGSARTEAEELRTRAAEELRESQDRSTDLLRDAQEHAARTREDAERDVVLLRDAAERFRNQMREHLDAHLSLLDRAPAVDELDEVAIDLPSGGSGDFHLADPFGGEQGSGFSTANGPDGGDDSEAGFSG